MLVAAGLGIGACGGSDDDGTSTAGGSATEPATDAAGGTEPAGTIEVIGKEFSYSPATVTVKAGQPVKIVLKNTGSIEHDITISKVGFKLTVPGSNTGEKVLKAGEPGTYKMYCSVAGHEVAGMKGELVVE
jgi:uncharacterized cupredoxin-like copper-binding protein